MRVTLVIFTKNIFVNLHQFANLDPLLFDNK